MDMFQTFTNTSYTFLELNNGGILGNTVKSFQDALGVFKERNGMNQNENMETVSSDATLHIRPNEAFLATVGGNTVGHGVSVEKNNASPQTYRIIGQVEGYNFHTGVLEFYRLTLKSESLADYGNGSS
jgi:hypothetical protein